LKLIDEIIELLSSKEGSLSEALLKTKILLHKIGHKELIDWVNNELNGYPDKDNLPEYRILPAQVMANLANMAYQINHHPLPIGHLSKKYQDMYKYARLNESLAVLEKLASRDKGALQAPIPMEVNGLLGKNLDNGYIVQRAWCEIGIANVEQIFIQVRSRLLDFVLSLKDQFGNVDSDEEVKNLSKAIDTPSLFNNAIFGNNTTIVVGNNNNQKASNINLEGNFKALAEILGQSGVGENEIVELETAITNDANTDEITEKRFGPAVKKWLQNMMAKVIDTSWQIELGIAGNLLTDLLKKYYGWE
jgi:hypothetical protein